MEKLYIVHWGSAGADDRGNAKAFCGIHGVYTTKAAALEGLVECKEAHYNELIQNEDDEKTFEFAKSHVRIYGSEAEEYFEIDWSFADAVNEIYITISEQ